jgi:hypothetical protein
MKTLCNIIDDSYNYFGDHELDFIIEGTVSPALVATEEGFLVFAQKQIPSKTVAMEGKVLAGAVVLLSQPLVRGLRFISPPLLLTAHLRQAPLLLVIGRGAGAGGCGMVGGIKIGCVVVGE